MSKYTMGFFVVNKFFIPKGFSGITLYPFVFTTDESYIGNEKFCNHEDTFGSAARIAYIAFLYMVSY